MNSTKRALTAHVKDTNNYNCISSVPLTTSKITGQLSLPIIIRDRFTVVALLAQLF